MADDDHNQELSESTSLGQPPAAEEDLPERLRVHELARVLGTTSKRVLDALTDIDGRARSPQSSVDQADAVRVRELLAAATIELELPAESAMIIVNGQESEPESRLILETHDGTTVGAIVEQPAYMPLFVAPQPVIAAAPDIVEDTDNDADDGEDGEDAEADGADRPANRRRRRGRRGRGRGRGEQADGEGDEDESLDESGETSGESAGGGTQDTAEDGDDADDEQSGDEESSTGATRRRRRRRRRRAGTGEDAEATTGDDPPNTVVHERAPRAKAARSDGEIQGISGSTRLEAKRQRRRDGRDAGRRRPPILTEAEFLARREAVDRVMVVRDKIRTEPPHEGARYTQIAVLEDGIVVEHFVTSAASASMVGNIYLGIVQNVLPSMEAAFVDIGRGRNGVLYAGEVNWEAAGLGGANRKIEQALKPGDYVVVQVSKDPVGHKGARLTTQVSLAGRYLVYVPGASSAGISRKLPDTERQRLKDILREVVPAGAGVIIRTASEGVKEDDIRTDVNRLQERWATIAEEAERVKANKAGAAIALYEEPDVLVKVIRDLFNEDFSGLVVSGGTSWETITNYVNSVAPELLPKLTKYEPAGGAQSDSAGQAASAGPDVFAVYRIDEQLAKAMDRKVWLPSGGTLVIDRTEAMTVVDVNTGKFTGAGGNLEQTVTKNNLEAAEEIVRQLRLRDIGGIVVIDFIDMVLESNRDLVLRRLTEALARDRTRHQVSEVTSLGLVQLTRKKLGTGLIEAFSSTCSHCSGRGIMVHAEPVDHAPSNGRKSESTGGGRRNRRGRKGRGEEAVAATAEVVARVPAHVPGEHPMFKAMAAAKNGDEESDEESEDFDADLLVGEDDETGSAGIELVGDLDEDDDDLDDDDDDDDDDDEDDEDDEDDDEDVDDDDLDDDDDEDDDDEDDDLDDDDEDDDLDDDLDDDDEDDDDLGEEVQAPASAPTARVRRRTAARPAGPPAV